MPRRPKLARRLTTAASWPFGIAYTSWRYLWRVTAVYRTDRTESLSEAESPPLPEGVNVREVQSAHDGVGPLFHRTYRIRIRDPKLSPDAVIARLGADLNLAAPTEVAQFCKVLGKEGRLAVDDEIVVRMPGPWDGPVRVVEVTPVSFRLATLDGHLEAGQIEFRAEAGDGGDMVFIISSWARSGDRLALLMYERLRMAKEIQLHMWTSFLERIGRIAGGQRIGGIEIDTRCVAGAPTVGDAAARRILDDLHDRRLNFDPDQHDGITRGGGWQVDGYCQPLPPEEPGPPARGGSWEIAQRLLRDYEFADPRVVRAIYHPDRPLPERDMLLEIRFWGLVFRVGVRVGGVVDETRRVDGREVRVWGWNYRTLQGHLEVGQMEFQVWKWLDTGEVEFRTCRFSRHAPVANPLVRLGLQVFGRREQVKFARTACRRMARLTAAALDRPGAVDATPRVADRVRVQPAASPG